ncbi:MAG: hypothetical protein LUE96_07250 [Lachnospiraceae bacterium]|nr:hypothetical protein [Lachnospiraceae bacterium]
MRRSKLEKALDNSFINYFSDLFIVCMVAGWIAVLLIMTGFAAYATIVLGDTSMWSDVGTLVAVPLSAGGAIWMVKNSVQHAIANRDGKEAKPDFPKVNADGEDEGKEEIFNSYSSDEEQPIHGQEGAAG